MVCLDLLFLRSQTRVPAGQHAGTVLLHQVALLSRAFVTGRSGTQAESAGDLWCQEIFTSVWRLLFESQSLSRSNPVRRPSLEEGQRRVRGALSSAPVHRLQTRRSGSSKNQTASAAAQRDKSRRNTFISPHAGCLRADQIKMAAAEARQTQLLNSSPGAASTLSAFQWDSTGRGLASSRPVLGSADQADLQHWSHSAFLSVGTSRVVGCDRPETPSAHLCRDRLFLRDRCVVTGGNPVSLDGTNRDSSFLKRPRKETVAAKRKQRNSL